MTSNLVEPRSLLEASELLRESPDTHRLIGGGTGLMLMARSGFFSAETLISLRRVDDPGLHEIWLNNAKLHVGGLCTLRELERHQLVARHLPWLKHTLERLSSPRTRNVATVAGCVAHGDPHMDLPPYLLAAGAEIVVLGRSGERRMPCAGFYRGYYDVALEAGDVIIGLEIPIPPSGDFLAYRKFTGALHEDWPLVGLAVRISRIGDRVASAAIAAGAVGPAAIRLPRAEQALTQLGSQLPDSNAIAEISVIAASEVQPIDDHLATARYKRRIVEVELDRLLTQWMDARETR
jgi:aerobic carbon-monoxide dehydrogenase medium subunit